MSDQCKRMWTKPRDIKKRGTVKSVNIVGKATEITQKGPAAQYSRLHDDYNSVPLHVYKEDNIVR